MTAINNNKLPSSLLSMTFRRENNSNNAENNDAIITSKNHVENVTSTNKNKRNISTRTNKVGSVRILEHNNEYIPVPNRLDLKKDTFWYTKSEIALARKESYIMDQIQIHVKEKLLMLEKKTGNNTYKANPQLLEDKIDEISQWPPGDIADFLQQQQSSSTSSTGNNYNDGDDDDDLLSISSFETAVLLEEEEQESNDQKDSTDKKKQKRGSNVKDDSEEEKYMMSQIQYHVRQKLLTFKAYQGNKAEDKIRLNERVQEICSWETTKIADFLQSPKVNTSFQKNRLGDGIGDASSSSSSEDEDGDVAVDVDEDDSTTSSSSSSGHDVMDNNKLKFDGGGYSWNDEDESEPSGSFQTAYEANNDEEASTSESGVYVWEDSNEVPSTPDKTKKTMERIPPSEDIDNEDILSAFSIKLKDKGPSGEAVVKKKSLNEVNEGSISLHGNKGGANDMLKAFSSATKTATQDDDGDILEAFSLPTSPNNAAQKKGDISNNLEAAPPSAKSAALEDESDILEAFSSPSKSKEVDDSDIFGACSSPRNEQEDDNDILEAFSLLNKECKTTSTEDTFSSSSPSKQEQADRIMRTDPSGNTLVEEDVPFDETDNAAKRRTNERQQQQFQKDHVETKHELRQSFRTRGSDTALMTPTTKKDTDEQAWFKTISIVGSVFAILLAIYMGKQ